MLLPFASNNTQDVLNAITEVTFVKEKANNLAETSSSLVYNEGRLVKAA